jgi:hypothetical protein
MLDPNLLRWIFSLLVIGGLLYIAWRLGGGNGLNTLNGARETLKMALETNEQLNRRMNEQGERLDRQAERIDFLEVNARISRRQVEMLSDQVVGCGGTPVSFEEAAQAAGVTMTVFDETHGNLRHALTQAFDETELTILARDLGFNPEDIRGETLTEKAAELIDMTRRMRKVARFRAEVIKARPEFSRAALASIK